MFDFTLVALNTLETRENFGDMEFFFFFFHISSIMPCMMMLEVGLGDLLLLLIDAYLES